MSISNRHAGDQLAFRDFAWLFDADRIDWSQSSQVYLYDRTSPDRPGRERLSPEWKRQELEAFAKGRAVKVADYAIDRGKTGYRLNPGLRRLIALAQQTGFPILAWEWRRFGRGRPALEKLMPFAVNLVCLKPLATPEIVLQRESKKHSQAINPGGRPANRDFRAASFVLERLPQSWRSIASEMNIAGLRTPSGRQWSDKQAARLLSQFFAYRTF